MNELGAALSRQFQEQPGVMLTGAVVLFVALTAVMIGLVVTVLILLRRQARLLRGVHMGNLEEVLQRQIANLEAMERQIQQTTQIGAKNAGDLQTCLQRVGLVRYDAFPDMGGEQSFSVAILDAQGNGFVLSSLHSRHDLRVYAKPVISNDSAVALTQEERAAIRSATPAGATTPFSSGRGRERP